MCWQIIISWESNQLIVRVPHLVDNEVCPLPMAGVYPCGLQFVDWSLWINFRTLCPPAPHMVNTVRVVGGLAFPINHEIPTVRVICSSSSQVNFSSQWNCGNTSIGLLSRITPCATLPLAQQQQPGRAEGRQGIGKPTCRYTMLGEALNCPGNGLIIKPPGQMCTQSDHKWQLHPSNQPSMYLRMPALALSSPFFPGRNHVP